MADKKPITASMPPATAVPAGPPAGMPTSAAAAPAPLAQPAPAPAKVVAASATSKTLPAAERNRLIAEAAYFLAQRRGFTHGNDVQDWLNAEKAVEAALARRP